MITARQKEYLQVIRRLHSEHKVFPSVRNIMDAMRLTSPAPVQQAIAYLVEAGYIEKIGEKSQKMPRGYRLVPQYMEVGADHHGRKLPLGTRLYYEGERPIGYWVSAETLYKELGV